MKTLQHINHIGPYDGLIEVEAYSLLPNMINLGLQVASSNILQYDKERVLLGIKKGLLVSNDVGTVDTCQDSYLIQGILLLL